MYEPFFKISSSYFKDILKTPEEEHLANKYFSLFVGILREEIATNGSIHIPGFGILKAKWYTARRFFNFIQSDNPEDKYRMARKISTGFKLDTNFIRYLKRKI